MRGRYIGPGQTLGERADSHVMLDKVGMIAESGAATSFVRCHNVVAGLAIIPAVSLLHIDDAM